MQFPVFCCKQESDSVFINHFRTGDVMEVCLVKRVGHITFQRIKGKLDIMRSDRGAV